jgi:hypothetical protein
MRSTGKKEFFVRFRMYVRRVGSGHHEVASSLELMMAFSLRRRRFAPREAQRSGRICGSLDLPPDPDGSSTQPLSSRPNHDSMNWKTSAGVTSIDHLLAVLDDAYQDFSWTIWHEGVRAFDDGEPGAMRDIETVRLEAIQKWVHDTEAQSTSREHGSIANFSWW